MLVLSALKVLILAGGVSAAENHHSHLVHVQGLQALLSARGVPAQDVAVFWADGADPAPDRSVSRAPAAPEAWLIAGLPSGNEVDPGPELEHTAFPDGAARPATRDALRGWLAEVGPGLRAGDTLLVAVTDHGEPDPAGGTETRINLWGEETWNPTQLLEDLAPVPEAARVVLWMSQCHSGGFADLARRRDNLCGTFSATPDRVAYGCYPELAGREDVGHFQRMLEALTREADVAAATAEVILTDDTPDVPHLTSDALLYAALTTEADRVGAPVATFIDARLEAGGDAEADANRRLAAGVALRYGLGMLRDHSAALDVLDEIGAARYALESWRLPWERAFDNARGLLVEEAARRVGEPKSREARLAAGAKLLAGARKAWAKAPVAVRGRVTALRERVAAADALASRLDLQEAAALRVAWLQGRVAGPLVLDATSRRRLATVRACERAPLLPAPATASAPAAPSPAPLPLVRQAVAEVEALRPGHLGLEFRDRPKYAGVLVDRVLPGSPLLATELQPGDALLAVNGWTLQRRGDFRESVLLATPGLPLSLTGRRGRTPFTVQLPSPPMPLPAPPPLLGEVVGELRLRPLDAAQGLPPIGEGRPAVLFYWATWCKPCKAALPALQAWSREHDVPVVAITDEGSAVVHRFLNTFGGFPFPIALDAEGEARRLFAVDSLPVFVLVDAARRLTQLEVGFDAAIPLAPPPT